MDRATTAGLLLAIGALLGGQYLEGGHLLSILQPAAAVIVIGGTLASVLVGASGDEIRRGLQLLPEVFRGSDDRPAAMIGRIVRIAEVARKDGLVAVEETARGEDDPFLRTALQTLVDGSSSQAIRESLEADLAYRHGRDVAGIGIYEAAAGVAPTMGILGAVLGLIHVMENLAEPSELGSGIATAFVATLYGIGVANLALLPVAAKLHSRIDARRRTDALVVEGAVAIHEGQSPRAVRESLGAHLALSTVSPRDL